MRAHAYGGVDQSNGGEPFFVIRTDVELQFNRDCGEERKRREPAKPLAGKGGKVKPGKTLNNEHHDMPLCTLRESDGSKPARSKESFKKVYVMDAVQENDDSLVWYRNVSFRQRRVWLAMNSGVSNHGTCHSLKNDANAGKHVGLDKADIII